MNAETLRAVMLDRISLDLARAMLPHYVAAMHAAGCTTVNRAAMWGAQIGHESASLRYMEELASGAAYEGRKDLGNTHPGDGKRFKGRGPIQLTGRFGYEAFSQWCHARGLVSSPTYFVDHPTEVASPRWGFLAASHYWVVRRPKINGLCDRGDLDGVTRQINGGLNGITDRRQRWDHCRLLGARLLPSAVDPTPAPAPPAPVTPKGLPLMIERPLVAGQNVGTVICPTGDKVSKLVKAAWVSVRAAGGVSGHIWFQCSANSAGPAPGTGSPMTVNAPSASRPWAAIPAGTEYIEYQLTAAGPGSLLIEQQAA